MRAYKVAYSVGAVALVLAGAAQAALTGVKTGSLDQWSMTNGTISGSSCPTGFSCAPGLHDDGFMTRLVTHVSSGEQYFQTVVATPGASITDTQLQNKTYGDNSDFFSDENFVSFNNVSGILDKQHLFQIEKVTNPGTGTNPGSPVPVPAQTRNIIFTNHSVIGTGWAKDFVELTQTIEDVRDSANLRGQGNSFGDGFQLDFIYKQVGYSDGAAKLPDGKAMKITNYVPLGQDNNPNSDRQDFVLVETAGTFTKVGSVDLPDKPLLQVNPGQTLSWDTPDRVQAIWIGQDLKAAGSTFGYVGYTKWDDPFAANANSQNVNMFSLSSNFVDYSVDPVVGHRDSGDLRASTEWDPAVWGDVVTRTVLDTTNNPPTVTYSVTDPFAPVP